MAKNRYGDAGLNQLTTAQFIHLLVNGLRTVKYYAAFKRKNTL